MCTGNTCTPVYVHTRSKRAKREEEIVAVHEAWRDAQVSLASSQNAT